MNTFNSKVPQNELTTGQTPGRVSFTIGDSSDCDSVSTVTSGTILTPTAIYDDDDDDSHGYEDLQPQYNDTNCCNGNQWHKFHFHNDIGQGFEHNGTMDKAGTNENGGIQGRSNNDNDDESSSEGRGLREFGRDSMSTTRMVPISVANYSLARLSDVDYRDGGSSRTGEGFCSRNWGKWRILVAFSIVQLFSALMVSLQAPFYPAEAEKKGASATEYGFVFGVFELTVFIVAPFYGSRINSWNPKLVFNFGIITAALSSIIFGILDKIESGKYFILACALVRALEALGECAVTTASFVIVSSAFPDSVASTFALMETFYSIGLIAGPIVGSLFYGIGGYSLPFMVVGGGLLITTVLNFIVLPSSREISEYQQNNPVIISSYTSFRLLGSAAILVSAICIVIGAMSISSLQATLEPHMRQFDLTQLSVGAIMVINLGVYSISTPFYGILCDKILQLKLVTFCGSVLLVCGYSLVGPIPILPFKPSVWIISLGLALQGIGLGAMLVASYVSILRNAINNGLPDSPSTYGLVSSLWTSMFSLGSFIGPITSGIFYDTIGFSNGTLAVIALTLTMMCILVLFICISDSEMNSFTRSETEPLLDSNSVIAASASFYSEHQSDPSTTNREWASQTGPRDSYGST